MDSNQKSVRLWLRLMELGRKLGCHQMPERSFFIGDWQFPLCSRCSGVIFGWLLSVVLIWFYRPGIITIPVCCLIMFSDWFLQARGLIKNNNPRRFITGTLGGYALMSLYIELFLALLKLFK